MSTDQKVVEPPTADPTSAQAGLGRRVVRTVVPYLVAVVAAFAVGALIVVALGHDPVQALQSVFTTSFKSRFGFVETMHKWVPIVLCALAFTVPLSTGKFNIGAEGQLLVGATAGVAAGILGSDLPMPVLLPVVILAGVLGGVVWAGISALLLVKFGVNEILSTVLLNFVSFQVVDYVASHVWPDVGAGHPATVSVGEGALLPKLGTAPGLHTGVLLTLVACVVIAVAMRATSSGFEMRAVGANPRASLVHGLKVPRLAGAGLVIGGGIAVLEVGASSMQRTAQVPVEVVLIIEALILLFVLLSDVPKERFKVGR